MAGLHRVQTAERVHYYFSRKCMVWTNREVEHGGWRVGHAARVETHVYTGWLTSYRIGESQCAVHQTAILPTLGTLVVQATSKGVDHNFRFLLTVSNYFYCNRERQRVVRLRLHTREAFFLSPFLSHRSFFPPRFSRKPRRIGRGQRAVAIVSYR